MNNTEPIRALVLSGGGGRGAFHAGVYKYLMSENKEGVDPAHAGPWKPSIVTGTSIGAVNGAAIAQGMTAEELVDVWEHLEEGDVQGMPPIMRGLTRRIVSRVFGKLMSAKLPTVPKGQATSRESTAYWPPFDKLPHWLADLFVGRWMNLLDTGPIKETLVSRFKFDADKLAASETALLITATSVQTGERILFSNREVYDRKRGCLRSDVRLGITRERVLASMSIPLIYPWTRDDQEEGEDENKPLYWDGALVANTPLGAALDLMGEDADSSGEVVIVMMTPWLEQGKAGPLPRKKKTPDSFEEAITWMLDWMLLSSFRENLKMIDFFNELAEQERSEDKHPNNGSKPAYRFRRVRPVIVAPEEFMNAERIIDYDGKDSAELINMGFSAAQKAFKNKFPVKSGAMDPEPLTTQ